MHKDNHELYKTAPWKTEHRRDGVSFLLAPFEEDNKIKYFTASGPLNPECVNWIEKAILNEQSNTRSARPVNT